MRYDCHKAADHREVRRSSCGVGRVSSVRFFSLSGRMFLSVLAMTASLFLCEWAEAASAERWLESYRPSIQGAPVALLKRNPLTQSLGGRVLDVDVWAGQTVRYDDNIYQTAKDSRSDVVNSTAIGVKLQGEQRDAWKLWLEGQLQYHSFVKHTEHNGAEGYFRSWASADVSPALALRVSAEGDRTYGTLRHEQTISPLNRYAVSAGTVLRPSPFAGISFDYRYTAQRHDLKRLERQDYDEHALLVRPYHAVTPYTTVFVQAVLAQALPRTDWYGDSLASSLTLGMEWAFRDAARVQLEAGVTHISFDSGRSVDSTADLTRPILRLRTEFALAEEWKAGLRLSSQPVIGATSSDAMDSRWIDRVQVSSFLCWSPDEGFSVTVAPFFRDSEPSRNAGYVEYGTVVSMSRCLTDWCSTSFGWRWSVIDYSDQQAYDRNQITVGVAAAF